LPGAGGAPEIAALAGEVLVVMRQSTRSFVERLDFRTSAGFLEGGTARERAALTGKGPVGVVTDLCVFEPDPETRELTVVRLHPGVRRETVAAATGWPVRFSPRSEPSAEPTVEELEALRYLSGKVGKGGDEGGKKFGDR
jgi:glutaconate CoA-transferase subunit B